MFVIVHTVHGTRHRLVRSHFGSRSSLLSASTFCCAKPVLDERFDVRIPSGLCRRIESNGIWTSQFTNQRLIQIKETINIIFQQERSTCSTVAPQLKQNNNKSYHTTLQNQKRNFSTKLNTKNCIYTHECTIIFCNMIKVTQTCDCEQCHKRVYLVIKLKIKISDALHQFEFILVNL